MKERKGVKQDIELDAEDLKELVKEFKAIYLEKQGEEFPQDPKEQLIGAVKAVFRSWDNPRANVYRKMNEIPYEWALLSTFSRWLSVTPACVPAPVLLSPVTPLPAKRS